MLDHPIDVILTLIAIIISITVHEFAHAKSAELAGDPTPRAEGRVTLNPLAHFDPIGFLMIVLTTLSGFGIGWGKPVNVNIGYFRHPRLHFVLVAAWGPLANLILATLAAIPIRLASAFMPPFLRDFLILFVIINVSLAMFNLIPIHPLDGSKIFGGLLPWHLARRYWNFMLLYGPMLLLGLIVILPLLAPRLDVLELILRPVVLKVISLLLGVPL